MPQNSRHKHPTIIHLHRAFDAEQLKRNLRTANADKIKQIAANTLQPALEEMERAEEARKAEQFANRSKGYKVPDGTVFMGISPSTGQEFYAMSHDSRLYLNFNSAAAQVRKMNQQKELGYNDWRVPTADELSEIYKLHGTGAFKGGFDLTNKDRGGWYWASESLSGRLGKAVDFTTGLRIEAYKASASSVRFVRGPQAP